MQERRTVSAIGGKAFLWLNCLMDLYDISFGVMKKDLMPLLGKGRPIVGIGNIVCIKNFFERFDVVRSESDVTAFNGVYYFAVFEGDVEVSLRQMHLHTPVSGKAYLAAVAFVFGLIRAWKVINWNVGQTQYFRIETMQSGDVVSDVIDMVELKLHTSMF